MENFIFCAVLIHLRNEKAHDLVSHLTIWFSVCSWYQHNKISLSLYLQQFYLLKQANYNVFL